MLPHKKSISHIVWILVACLVGTGLGYAVTESGTGAYGFFHSKTKEYSRKEFAFDASKDILTLPPVFKITKITTDTITLGFVGDIIPEVETTDIFYDMTVYTKRPDIMIGNLEGAAAKNEYLKCAPEALHCFSFNGDHSFLSSLAQASFDVLNVANNHFNDYGEKGREETLQEIEKAGMMASGLKNEITYIKKNNFTVGVLGFSTYWWTTDMNNMETVNKLVGEANQNADIVVVIFHGGGEGAAFARTPLGKEIYVNEDRGDVRAFAHQAIDSGADIVVGSGPHVLRGIETYGGKLIAYSLGNFASASARASGMPKISAMLEITFEKDGVLASFASLTSGTVFPLIIDEYGIPHPDLNNTALSVINDLSKSDFGSQGVEIDPLGDIIFK